MIGEMARQNFKPKLVAGASSLSDFNFLNPLTPEEVPNLLTLNHLYPVDDPRATECIQALAKYDPSVKPSRYTQEGCLAAKVFVEALTRAGKSPTREGLIRALENMKGFDPGIGVKIGFSPDNHLGTQELLQIGVKDKRFVVTGAPLPVQLPK
jgi:ABC-type branched-subunit amino acid transport system substrate-binding protein